MKILQLNSAPGMAMAAPMVVAAPVAFSSDAVSPPMGTQWHWDQQWRLLDQINAGRRLPPKEPTAFIDILRSAMAEYAEHCP